MHIRYDVISNTTRINDNPVLVGDLEAKMDSDTELTAPIYSDGAEDYQGRVSPRVTQWLVDRVRELQLEIGS